MQMNAHPQPFLESFAQSGDVDPLQEEKQL